MMLDEHVKRILGALTFQLAELATENDQLREKLVALEMNIAAASAKQATPITKKKGVR